LVWVVTSVPSRTHNPELFPPFVEQHTITFDPGDPSDLEQQFPGTVLPASLARAVRKRQAEFLAGRWCAREALRVCAPEVAEAPVAIGPHHEPLWPAGVVGSITHTHGFASVAVARSQRARAIGLDAERVLRDEQVPRIVERIAGPGELTAIMEATAYGAATALTAIFSAKEAIFKALYAEVGRYFDFRDAWVDALDFEGGTFRARLCTKLTPQLPDGYELAGRFSVSAGLVCTALILPP
jgi:enterobactin synthetase component D